MGIPSYPKSTPCRSDFRIAAPFIHLIFQQYLSVYEPPPYLFVALILSLTKGELEGVVDVSSGIGIVSFRNSTLNRSDLPIAALFVASILPLTKGEREGVIDTSSGMGIPSHQHSTNPTLLDISASLVCWRRFG